MSEIDDLLELQKVMGTDVTNGGAVGKRTRSPADPYYDDQCGGNDFASFAQYTAYGPGLLPCARGTPKLPRGIFSIMDTQQGPIFVPMNVVTDTLLRLPDSKSDMVINEIEQFWTLKAEFERFGYTHKRGFLLYGPQGSGKTSTVHVVMQDVVKKGGVAVVVSDIHPGSVATLLGRYRQIEPERNTVVVLEDIDSIIGNFGEHDVLSLLDGEKSISNVVYIATTNYPERLQARVMNRPSRFDQVVKIGMPNADARRMYIESRNLGLTSEQLDQWVKMTANFSIAHVKEVIVAVKCLGHNLEHTVARLRAMGNIPTSDDDDPKGKVGFTVDSPDDFDVEEEAKPKRAAGFSN